MNSDNASLAPHGGMPVLEQGSPLEQAKAALILVHGRGADAQDIMGVGRALALPGFALLAPEAYGRIWLIQRYFEPLKKNEPELSSAFSVLAGLEARVVAAGIPLDRLFFLGFSQGACLCLSYALRHAKRYGGIFGLSGCLLGPEDAQESQTGNFEGTPVFLGCSDVDPYFPKERVLSAGEVFKRMGAVTTVQLYPGFAHTISEHELAFVQTKLAPPE